MKRLNIEKLLLPRLIPPLRDNWRGSPNAVTPLWQVSPRSCHGSMVAEDKNLTYHVHRTAGLPYVNLSAFVSNLFGTIWNPSLFYPCVLCSFPTINASRILIFPRRIILSLWFRTASFMINLFKFHSFGGHEILQSMEILSLYYE